MRYEEHADRILAFDDTDTCRSAAWGPAADGTGEWFLRIGQGKAVRVVNRDEALAEMRRQFGEKP